MPGSIQLHTEYRPPFDGLQFLDQALYDYNRAQTGKNDGKTFVIYHRNANGEILAGVNGLIWAQTCEIYGLWVHPALRRQGIGRQLMEVVEKEGRANHCRAICLKVYSFQSPEFFIHLGFQLLARLDENPPGYQTYYFVKQLLLMPEAP